ncbi:MAG: hypothetical protein KAI89_07380 [Emcibacter sp.]|nr:hypothetical protein [Emcibacter sp.]
MRLVQIFYQGCIRAAKVENAQQLQLIDMAGGVYALAQHAIANKQSLEITVEQYLSQDRLDYQKVIDQGQLLPPFTHPDPNQCTISGTGLTHLGSASSRDKMHSSISAPNDELTHTMRMFKMGVEGGKPADADQAGAQPEWFYKGDGSIVVAPEQDIPVPAYALDAGEEPELVGLYVIDEDAQPWRVGFAIGNEFSDHITERHNYLWLAHSKLRACSFGPELLIGQLPANIEGESRILRDGKLLWKKTFLTGEQNMCHSIANLEHHHFKYQQFRQPGSAHAHFFGTATLSHSDGVKTKNKDVFEIEAPLFGRPLRNALKFCTDEEFKKVPSL